MGEKTFFFGGEGDTTPDRTLLAVHPEHLAQVLVALGARRQDVRLQPRPDDVGGRVVPAVRAIRRVGPPRRDQRVQAVAADGEQHVERHRLGERHARVVVHGERLAPAHPVRVDPAGRGRDQRVEVVRQALVHAPEQPGQPARVLVTVLSVRRAAAVATRIVTVVVPPAFHRRRRSETRNNARPTVHCHRRSPSRRPNNLSPGIRWDPLGTLPQSAPSQTWLCVEITVSVLYARQKEIFQK